MKTKFNNKELAHVWFSQTQTRGSGSNMFFEGKSIYSYGKHFEIARIHEFKGKKIFLPDSKVTLFTSRGYSNTTARHKHHTLSAIHGICFTVPKVDADGPVMHLENAHYYADEIAKKLEKLPRVRTAPSEAFWDIQNHQNTLRNYLKIFKVVRDAKIKTALKPIPAKLHTLIREKQFRANQAKEKRAAKERIDARIRLEQWTHAEEGQYVSTTGFYNLPVALRRRKALNDDLSHGIIETSHGATITEAEARVFYGHIQSATTEAGERVGRYVFQAVEGDIVKIGCHLIPLSEIHRIGKELEAENKVC